MVYHFHISDTIYTHSSFETMIDEIIRPNSGIEKNQFYFYFSNSFFDLEANAITLFKSVINQTKNDTILCLEGIHNGGFSGDSCINDYFGFNYETAKKIR